MIFVDFDFLSSKYTLVSFLSIGNAYFSFILLFSTFYSLFRHTIKYFMHEFRKTELINRACSCRILRGFPLRMADLFDTTGKPWTPSFRLL